MWDMDRKHRDSVKETFLKHIGKVIKRNRKKEHNMLQSELASLVGVSDSNISRYENGEGDITAAMMAYIAVALKFPLSEYVEYYDYTEDGERTKKTVDVLFKELFFVANKDYVMKKLGIAPTISGTELNEDTNQYEFSMEMSKTMNVSNLNQQERFSNAAPMLREYMMNDETGATEMLEFAYYTVKHAKKVTPPLQELVGTILVYVEAIADDVAKPYIKEYIKELCRNNVGG